MRPTCTRPCRSPRCGSGPRRSADLQLPCSDQRVVAPVLDPAPMSLATRATLLVRLPLGGRRRHSSVGIEEERVPGAPRMEVTGGAATRTFTGDCVRIGRSMDNDVVVLN